MIVIEKTEKMDIVITTSYDASERATLYAQQLANEFGWVAVARGRQSIQQLKNQHQEVGLLIVTNKGLNYYKAYDSDPFFFHPSLATIRMKRLQQGETDTLAMVAEVKAGDVVLDCTAGMASDAIVLSHCVGEEGKVMAIESELIPYVLVREGLKQYKSPLESLNKAMRRIEMKHGDHLTFLQQQPDKSVDIVYFDPMFRRPLTQSNAINPLRTIANEQPLQRAAIEEARRIARKKIVLKEHRKSDEFERLGFTKLTGTQSKIAYGVIEI